MTEIDNQAYKDTKAYMDQAITTGWGDNSPVQLAKINSNLAIAEAIEHLVREFKEYIRYIERD